MDITILLKTLPVTLKVEGGRCLGSSSSGARILRLTRSIGIEAYPTHSSIVAASSCSWLDTFKMHLVTLALERVSLRCYLLN